MALNALQQIVIEQVFEDYLEEIIESDLSPKTKRQIIQDLMTEDFNDGTAALSNNHSAPKIQKILRHPHPQNRMISDNSYNPDPEKYCIYRKQGSQINRCTSESFIFNDGCVVNFCDLIGAPGFNLNNYNPEDKLQTVANTEIIAKEPKGLLGLTQFGPASKQDVIDSFKLLAGKFLNNADNFNMPFTRYYMDKNNAETYNDSSMVRYFTHIKSVLALQVPMNKDYICIDLKQIHDYIDKINTIDRDQSDNIRMSIFQLLYNPCLENIEKLVVSLNVAPQSTSVLCNLRACFWPFNNKPNEEELATNGQELATKITVQLSQDGSANAINNEDQGAGQKSTRLLV